MIMLNDFVCLANEKVIADYMYNKPAVCKQLFISQFFRIFCVIYINKILLFMLFLVSEVKDPCNASSAVPSDGNITNITVSWDVSFFSNIVIL